MHETLHDTSSNFSDFFFFDDMGIQIFSLIQTGTKFHLKLPTHAPTNV